MNQELLNEAKKKVSDTRFLINGISRRATEIARGARPLVPTLPSDETDPVDIALQELVEGKIEIRPHQELE